MGNLSGSIALRKKIGLKTRFIVLISITNFICSVLGFFLIHKLTSTALSESLSGSGLAIRYGVFQNDRKYISNSSFSKVEISW